MKKYSVQTTTTTYVIETVIAESEEAAIQIARGVPTPDGGKEVTVKRCAVEKIAELTAINEQLRHANDLDTVSLRRAAEAAAADVRTAQAKAQELEQQIEAINAAGVELAAAINDHPETPIVPIVQMRHQPLRQPWKNCQPRKRQPK